MIARSVLAAYDVDVRGDNPWQQRARLHQSLWRQRHGLTAGRHRDQPLGSRLAVSDGEPPVMANYLSPAAQRQVQRAVAEAPSTGALLSRPRLWVDLLSSQPLCFNLFGPHRVRRRSRPQLPRRRGQVPRGPPGHSRTRPRRPVSGAARRYRRCLTDGDTFDVRTLDDVVQAARLATGDQWPAQVHERYLDPTPVNDAAAATIRGGSR